MKKQFALYALATTLVLTLGGCGIDFGNILGPANETTPTQSAPASQPDDQQFDTNDVMFAQMMIIHHQQAVEMSELALTASSNSEVLALAEKIRGAQQPEIETMTAWLVAAGATDTHMHDMAMPGLADAETMDQLRTLTDSAFDSLFLMTMIQHHEGAVTMARDVLLTTSNDDVRDLANAIIAAQTAEIDEMYLLLGP